MAKVKRMEDCMNGQNVIDTVAAAAIREPERIKMRQCGSSHVVVSAKPAADQPAKPMTLHSHKTGKGLAKKWWQWLLDVKIIVLVAVIYVVFKLVAPYI